MIAALFGIGIVTEGGEEDEEEPAPAADVERVARRLEQIRQLDFKEIPPVRTISAEQARAEGLAALDEEYPPKRRAADEQVLRLLGLLPDGSDLRELAGTVFAEEIAGFYDDRTEEMTLVAGAGGDEITLAHELTHALEDQHFDIAPGSGLDDERTARVALVEGTATVAMADYVARFLTPGGVRRRDLLDQLELVELLESSSGLPPYMQRSLLFPYTGGARFVAAIGTWGPANHALSGEGPVSTEQILHPEKYRDRERPLPVPAAPPPGPGWKRTTHGTIGEFDTGELIRTSDSAPRAAHAAAGWGGGRYDLWVRGDRNLLALAWRWDTPRDAAEFAASLPRYVEQTLGDVPVDVDVGPTVRLAIGPTE